MSIFKRILGFIDNGIDANIDRVLYRYETEPPEKFNERWYALPDSVRSATKTMLHEQMTAENDTYRLERLARLEYYLDSLV